MSNGRWFLPPPLAADSDAHAQSAEGQPLKLPPPPVPRDGQHAGGSVATLNLDTHANASATASLPRSVGSAHSQVPSNINPFLMRPPPHEPPMESPHAQEREGLLKLRGALPKAPEATVAPSTLSLGRTQLSGSTSHSEGFGQDDGVLAEILERCGGCAAPPRDQSKELDEHQSRGDMRGASDGEITNEQRVVAFASGDSDVSLQEVFPREDASHYDKTWRQKLRRGPPHKLRDCIAVVIGCILILGFCCSVVYLSKPKLVSGAFGYSLAFDRSASIRYEQFVHARQMAVSNFSAATQGNVSTSFSWRYLEIIYQKTNYSMVSEDGLSTVHRIEREILQMPTWNKLCSEQVPPDKRSLCQPGDSLAAFFYPSQFPPSDENENKGVVKEFIFDGKGSSPVIDFQIFIKYVLAVSPESYQRWIPEALEGAEYQSTFRSTFMFYLPTYVAETHWKIFLRDELEPKLASIMVEQEKEQEKEEADGIKLYYRADDLDNRALERFIQRDAVLCPFALACSFFGTLAVTRRLLLSFTALVVSTAAPVFAAIWTAGPHLYGGDANVIQCQSAIDSCFGRWRDECIKRACENDEVLSRTKEIEQEKQQTEGPPEIGILAFAAGFATAATCADLAISVARAWENQNVIWPWWLEEVNKLVLLCVRWRRRRKRRKRREKKRKEAEKKRQAEIIEKERRKRAYKAFDTPIISTPEGSNSEASSNHSILGNVEPPSPRLYHAGADLHSTSGSVPQQSPAMQSENTSLPLSIDTYKSQASLTSLASAEKSDKDFLVVSPLEVQLRRCTSFYKLLNFFAEAFAPHLVSAAVFLNVGYRLSDTPLVAEFAKPAGIGLICAVVLSAMLCPPAVELGNMLAEESQTNEFLEVLRNSVNNHCLPMECGANPVWRKQLNKSWLMLAAALETKIFRLLTFLIIILISLLHLTNNYYPRYSEAMPELFPIANLFRDEPLVTALYTSRDPAVAILGALPERGRQCTVDARDKEGCSWSQCEVQTDMEVEEGACRCYMQENPVAAAMARAGEGTCSAAARLWFPVLDPTLENEGKSCFDYCGRRAGYCGYCGTGACCRSGGGDNAPECANVVNFQTQSSYECVSIYVQVPMNFLRNQFWPWLESQSGLTFGSAAGAVRSPEFKSDHAFFAEMEDWGSGRKFTNQQVSTGIPSDENASMPVFENACVSALCFCGRHVCKLDSNHSHWTEVGVIRHSRRLEQNELDAATYEEQNSEAYPLSRTTAADGPLLSPYFFDRSSTKRRRLALGDPELTPIYVAWGLKLSYRMPLKVAPVSPEFSENFNIGDPWTQRAIMSFCEGFSPELSIVSTQCWAIDLRRWLSGKGQLYPLRELEFYGEFHAFLDFISISNNADTSYKYFWSDNLGYISATFISFQAVKPSGPDEQEAFAKAWTRFTQLQNVLHASTAGTAMMMSPLLADAEQLAAVEESMWKLLAVALVTAGVCVLTLTLSPGLMLATIGTLFGAVFYANLFVVGYGERALGGLELACLTAFMGYLVPPVTKIIQLYAHSCVGPGEEIHITTMEDDYSESTLMFRVRSCSDLNSPARESIIARERVNSTPFTSKVPLWIGGAGAERRRRVATALMRGGETVVGGVLAMFGAGFILMQSRLDGINQVGLILMACATMSMPVALAFLPILLLLGFGPSKVKLKAILELMRVSFFSPKQIKDPFIVSLDEDQGLSAKGLTVDGGKVKSRTSDELPKMMRSLSMPESDLQFIRGVRGVGSQAAGTVRYAGFVAGGVIGLCDLPEAPKMLRLSEGGPGATGVLGADGVLAGKVAGMPFSLILKFAQWREKRRLKALNAQAAWEYENEDHHGNITMFSLELEGATKKPPFHVVTAAERTVGVTG